MIRKYKIDDTEEIIDIWYSASAIAHPFFRSEFIEKGKKDIREVYLPKAETWVLEDKGELTGFISMLGNEIGGLFVKPEKHRQGIGKKLIDYVFQFKKELEVEVFEDNVIGRTFYQKYGFKKTKEYIHKETNHKILRMLFRG